MLTLRSTTPLKSIERPCKNVSERDHRRLAERNAALPA
jgi:hypothetical protein